MYCDISMTENKQTEEKNKEKMIDNKKEEKRHKPRQSQILDIHGFKDIPSHNEYKNGCK